MQGEKYRKGTRRGFLSGLATKSLALAAGIVATVVPAQAGCCFLYMADDPDCQVYCGCNYLCWNGCGADCCECICSSGCTPSTCFDVNCSFTICSHASS